MRGSGPDVCEKRPLSPPPQRPSPQLLKFLGELLGVADYHTVKDAAEDVLDILKDGKLKDNAKVGPLQELLGHAQGPPGDGGSNSHSAPPPPFCCRSSHSIPSPFWC